MTTRFSLFVATLVMGMTASVPAAAQWSFSQDGYSGGGVLTGSFSGVDVNLDGWLTSSDGEVSGFVADFYGDQAVSAFTLTRADLGALAYRVGHAALGEDAGPPSAEGFYAVSSSGRALMVGVAATGFEGAQVIDFATGTESVTLAPLHIDGVTSAVPEPATQVGMALGLVALGVRFLRRKA